MRRKFILFDFDGVIADSFDLAYEVSRIKCPHLSRDDYRRRFDGNINETETLLTHTTTCRLDIDFATEYAKKVQSVRPFHGMPEIIEALAREHTLIVISSTTTDVIWMLLDTYGLSSCFAQVMGNDLHKSKVKKIRMVFDTYGSDIADYVFVTDSLGDIREAREAGLDAIAVTWGFHNRETLLRGKPFRLLDQPKDLHEAVVEYFRKNTVTA